MNNMQSGHGTVRVQRSQHLRLGNFGKLFPNLTTWAEDYGIQSQTEATEIMAALGARGGIMHDARGNSEDSPIPAAYTFFAQFVDHDITLDAESQLGSQPLNVEQIRDLPNLRSASLDLDSVYGFGPDISPYLYQQEPTGFLSTGSNVRGVENPHDVPRTSQGVALIGDFRNDENLFLSQMHLVFLRFHNRLRFGRSFEEAQREARYHYQYIVLRDLLERVCHGGVYEYAVAQLQLRIQQSASANDRLFRLASMVNSPSDPLIMPVEFSGGRLSLRAYDGALRLSGESGASLSSNL